MTEREITVRAIEAYLTADKITHRKPKAEQILVALERLGFYVESENLRRRGAVWWTIFVLLCGWATGIGTMAIIHTFG